MTKASGGRAQLVIVCESGGQVDNPTGRIILELAQGLSESGWAVTILCRGEVCVPAGVEMVAITKKLGGHGLLRRMLGALHFTLGVAWWTLFVGKRHDSLLFTSNPPVLSLLAPMMAGLNRRPYAILLHDIYPDILSSLGLMRRGGFRWAVLDALTVWSYRSARLIVVLGRDMSQIVRARCRGSTPPVEVIPNWPDARMASSAAAGNRLRDESTPSGGFLVQYSGNLGRTHDLEPLLQAAAMLAADGVVFNLIGRGALKKHWATRIEELKLRNVRLLDLLPEERLGEVASAPDVSLVLLRADCCGLSVPSKTYGLMAAGRPLVAILPEDSEVGMMVREVGCGMVIHPPDPLAIANALRRLRSDPAGSKKMAAAGRCAAFEIYSLRRAVSRYDECLRRAFTTEARGA